MRTIFDVLEVFLAKFSKRSRTRRTGITIGAEHISVRQAVLQRDPFHGGGASLKEEKAHFAAWKKGQENC